MMEIWAQKFEMLNKMDERLLVVTAPAGFGKTTLIREWCNQSNFQSIWFTVKKVHIHTKKFWSDLKILLNQNTKIDHPVIVIDDFHYTEVEGLAILNFVESFIDTARIILISRHHLQFPEKIRMIATDELRLDSNASFRFFEHYLDGSLSETQFSKLYQWTHGWIAGMRLLVLIANHYGSLSEFIANFQGEHDFLSEYFTDVLQTESQHLKLLLMQTASVKIFDDELCNNIFERSDLKEIIKSSLFVLENRKDQNYKFEPLFQSFLEGELRGVFQEEKNSWYRKASEWYAEKGKVEAIKFSILANQPKKAASLMIRFASQLFDPSFWSDVENWRFILSRLKRKQKARVLLFYGWIDFMKGSFDRLNETLQDSELVIRESNLSSRYKGELMLLRSLNAFLMKDINAAVEWREKAFSILADENIYVHEEMNLNDCEAQMVRGRNGLNGCVVKVLHYFESFQEHQSLFSETVIGFGKCIYAEAAYEANSMEEASMLAMDAVKIAFQTHMASLIVPSVLLYVKILQNEDRNKEAFQLLNQAKMEVQEEDRLWKLLLLALEIRMLIRNKEKQKAKELVYLLLANSHETPVKMHEYESLTYARILIEFKDFMKAKVFLEELLFEAESHARYGTRVEVLTLLAIVNWKTQRFQNGLEVLTMALPFAEKEGYIRMFLDEGKTMYDMLSKLSNQSIYVKKLLRLFEEENQISDTSIRLTNRERDVLRLISEGMTNKQMANQLNVTVGTIKGYASALFKKLNVKKRTQAVMRGKDMGLL